MSVEIHGLNIAIGGKPIVTDVDLSIADGERVGLIGSSGSGKSMIAKSLLGLLPREAVLSGTITMGETAILSGETAESRHGQEDDSGSDEERGAADRHHVAGERRVATSGHDSAAYADEHTLADLRGRYVGTVFQNPAHALNPVMTVAQQIALPLRLHYDLTKAERAERVNTMLDKVGLDRDVAGTYPHELSGGQQQRVGIATALITSPRFIIADEPTTALDSITQRQIVDLLTSLVDDAGASMLFITKSFGPRAARHQVLFDVSADVHAGECLAVIGGSGSGKSTLTRIMLGLESADSGSVEYESQSIVGGRKSPGFATLRRESGLVFQDPFSSLDPRWQVAKSVAEPLSLQRRDLNNTDIDERVVAALTMAGLEPADFLNRYPSDLSGGQAQRVVIARAIINEPKVILADEPMSAIDVAARIQILDAFAAIREARPSTAIIMVSHDLGVVQHIANRILVLHDGRVEETGPTAEVLGNPQSDYTRQLIEAASL